MLQKRLLNGLCLSRGFRQILSRTHKLMDADLKTYELAQDAPRRSMQRLVMFDLPDDNKKLILHAAYYAVAAHDWRDHVFSSKMDRATKRELIGKFPSGDPLNNLLNLAERLMPEFDAAAPINSEIEKIKAFVYGT